jgi:uncharacterized surface protein with fasciclin (FAS1) repeats
MFFVESDFNTMLDSTLMYNPVTKTFSIWAGGVKPQEFSMGTNDLRNLILNHVAIDEAKGVARKEFIPNLAGNIIIVNNETGEVSGTAPTKVGYRGSTPATEKIPTVLNDAVDNGTTYDIKNWFSFSTPTMYNKILMAYPDFHALLKKAGLTNEKELKLNFISDNDFYTVFIPNSQALDEAGLNTLPVDQLKNILLFHFVQGDMIFTDGNKPKKYYETARIDEKSTTYTTIYTSLFIKPDIDIIDIPAKDGTNYVEVVEANNTTNILTGFSTGNSGREVFNSIINNGVIHEIDKVLKVEELETK